MGKELCLEVAVYKRIRLLRTANDQREPVILKVGAAGTLDGAHRDGPLRRDDELVVGEVLYDDIHMATCLDNSKQKQLGQITEIPTKTSIRGAGLLDRPNLDTKISALQEKRISSAPASC